LDDGSVAFLEKEVVQFAKHHAFVGALYKCIDDVKDKRYQIAIDRMADASSVGENAQDLGMSLFKENPADVLKRININRIRTNYPTLDRLLMGGLGAGELGVILGPTGRGKSIVALDLAATALYNHRGCNVLVISTEMNQYKNFRRLYSRVTGVAGRDQTQQIPEITKRLRVFGKHTQATLRVKYWPAQQASVADIRSLMLRLAAIGEPTNLLIVDYADYLISSQYHKEKRHDISQIYLDLMALGGEFQIPIWSPSQSNRGSYDKKRVILSDIAEDFGKAQKAHVVIAICQTEEEYNDIPPSLRLFMAKNRDEKAWQSILMNIDYDWMGLTDLGLV